MIIPVKKSLACIIGYSIAHGSEKPLKHIHISCDGLYAINKGQLDRMIQCLIAQYDEMEDDDFQDTFKKVKKIPIND